MIDKGKLLESVAAVVLPEDVTGPTWDEMRGHGCMVIDDAMQKLAVYAGACGAVVLMEQHIDSPVHHTVIDHGMVPALITALTKAEVEAVEVWKEIEADIEQMTAGLEEDKGGASGAQ